MGVVGKVFFVFEEYQVFVQYFFDFVEFFCQVVFNIGSFFQIDGQIQVYKFGYCFLVRWDFVVYVRFRNSVVFIQ